MIHYTCIQFRVGLLKDMLASFGNEKSPRPAHARVGILMGATKGIRKLATSEEPRPSRNGAKVERIENEKSGGGWEY